MSDPQEPLPEKRPEATPLTPGAIPPADASAKKAAPAKKTPAKKAPAKKAPAKKVPAENAAPAKKAPAGKVPAKKAAPPPPEPATPVPVVSLPEAMPEAVVPVSVGAKEAAAQAKSTVEQASDSVAAPVVQAAERGRSPLPIVVALVVSLLAVLVVRQLRRN
jgi:cobalamin biosynthesis Mg chelatase CobN